MPVSKNGKNHKNRVNEYKRSIQVSKKKLKEKMMREYFEQVQQHQQSMRQENGELITNDDINIDLDVDLGMTEQIQPNIEDAVIINDIEDNVLTSDEVITTRQENIENV